MVIIGFVVTVMIFSSFAIVFSNSGNNLNTSNKQILNLPEKSLTSTVVNKYQIDLSNLPSGNGYYQQLITLNNYDTYGINSNGSNIQFFSSNYTQLYAWIQSINSTSMQIWIKNFNQSSIMYLYVLQSYENLFSSKGYLGEAPQLSVVYGEYDNGKNIFSNLLNNKEYGYANFIGNSTPDSAGYLYTPNGLYYNSTYGESNFNFVSVPNANVTLNFYIYMNQVYGNYNDIVSYTYSGSEFYSPALNGLSHLIIPTYSSITTNGYNNNITYYVRYVLSIPDIVMPTYTINQILNLQHGVTKTVTMSNAINSPIAPIEFYSNFMVYVDSNNYIYITNLSSGLNVNTTLIFNNTSNNAYYGLIIHNNYLYLYYVNNNFLLYVYSYTLDNLVNINLNTLSLPDNPHGNLGLTANSNGIYNINICYYEGAFYLTIYAINYNATLISYKKFSNITYSCNSFENYNFYTMGNFLTLTDENAGDIYLLNLNNLNIYQLKGNENYGEMIYNNSYQNNFKTIDNSSLNNIYISNYVSYGCIYNYIKPTDIIEPEFYNSRQTASNDLSISFIEANFYNNAYVNFTGYLKYNNSYAVKLGSYTLPYTILNNSIYYAINSYSYGIEYLNTYILNITSYNHDSYQLKDYFYYNDNIYSGLQFNFTNDNGIFSILPLNYSVYVYNGSYITTSSSEFKSIGNGIYEYNLSIYYGQLTTNTTSSIKPLDISSYIYPIGIIIFVSFLGAMVYFSKNEGKK